MERLHEAHFSVTSLADEHAHRYKFASILASGRVADCACGIGYGSQYLLENPEVESYFGIDPSNEAIEHAMTKYVSERTKFSTGTLEQIPYDIGEVDTFVMLETLEHVVDPAAALISIKRHLTPDALLIGTVPSEHYEHLCERAYSPNPYHLQRFSVESLDLLLGDYFEAHQFFAAEFLLGTLITALVPDRTDIASSLMVRESKQDQPIEGSILFVAGSKKAVSRAINKVRNRSYYFRSMSKAKADLEEVKPLRETCHKLNAMVAARDEAIKAQTILINDRDDLIKSNNSLIADRDGAIKSQAALIRSRNETIQAQAEIIDQRDTVIVSINAAVADLNDTIQAQTILIDERDSLIKTQDDLIADRDGAIQSQATMIRARDEAIQAQAESLHTRDAAIASVNAILADFNAILADFQRMLTERETALKLTERMVGARDEALAAMKTRLQQRDQELIAIEHRLEEQLAAAHSTDFNINVMRESIELLRSEVARRESIEASFADKVRVLEGQVLRRRWWRRR